MSVNNTKLIMYGVEIQYPHYDSLVNDDSDKYEELDIFYDKTPGKIGFVSDGMSGEYAVGGTVISRFSEEDELFTSSVMPLDEVFSRSISPESEEEVVDGLEKILGYRPVCKYLFVNHYS